MRVGQSASELDEYRLEADAAYKKSLDPAVTVSVWHVSVDKSRAELERAIEATANLTGIREALEVSGAYVRALRHLMAPPLSQDQFKLACAAWSKGTEKNGRPLKPDQAEVVAKTISTWLDPRITQELAQGSHETALRGAIYLMASQMYQTERRNVLAAAQEEGACEVLDAMGFTRTPSVSVDQHGIVGPRCYMRKTNFLTADGASHEVDIAVGFEKNLVLALECKVSNDATNSIKRVNDVLKKHEAWKKQWGKFLVTGALLQGVFAAKDIERLRQERVQVVWSHRLDGFRDLIQEMLSE